MNARTSSHAVPSFLARFQQTVISFPDATALYAMVSSGGGTESGRTLSYKTLDGNARVIQCRLAQLDIEAGAPIAIHTRDRVLAITAMLAILRHGCPYLPLDPLYPRDRLDYMVSHAGTVLTLTDNDEFRSPVGQHLDLRDLSFDEPVAPPPVREITPQSSAYIIYTSGSTGKPKGVLMNHGTLDNLIHWQNRRYPADTRYRTLQFSALGFDVSFQEIFSTLTQGGTLYLIDNEIKQDFRQLLQYIDQHQIERIFLPYIALLQLVMWANRLRQYPPSLREIITAGEQLVVSKELRTAFNALKPATLCNQYGPCETHVVSEHILRWPPEGWPSLPPIGKAIDQARLLILNEAQQPVAAGDVGELYIAGPVLAHGYINSPEQTAQRFVTLPEMPGGQPARAYRTGDLVSCDEEGELLYHGRIDNQVKINGYRVELSEVEAHLLDTGLVDEAAVAVQDLRGQKKLVAFVTGKAGLDDNHAALRAGLARLVPDYMVPSRFHTVSALTKTPSGKIDRKSMIEGLDSTPVPKSPDNTRSTEALLAIIRAEMAQPDLAPEDNLQDRGMDSLTANRVAAACFDQLGVSVPVYTLFQYRTLGQFVDYALSRAAVVVPAQRSGTEPGNGSASRDVAIIGLAVRVPGASSIESFWQNLVEGRESITFFSPTDQKDGEVNARGVLDDPLGFDDRFFGISPIEAEFVDPQQRLLLELAWHALENAGYDPEVFAGRIGVYCGVGNNSYYLNNVLRNEEKLDDYGPLQAMVANEKDYAATRLAHKLNLVGPALSIHTACSTSLVAVAEAVEAIRHGRCDMAIAGGASITFPQQQPHTHQEGSIYTRDGHTRPFDQNSSGTVFSDGGGLLVLKRLEDAQRDGDHIYAAISGVAVNNDGAEKGSFSAPSVQGQKSVILGALRDAQLDVNRIGYVEAHGTATPIGDPIEVAALSAAFAEYTPAKQFCKLGSVKSNFGHLTAGAGVIGLIKCALAVERGIVPQSINFESANPELSLPNTPFTIADCTSEWSAPVSQRIAGVSSFGIGGTNAHAVLRGVAPVERPQAEPTPAWVPLCFSARSPEALAAVMSAYEPALASASPIFSDRAALAAALIQHRRAFSYCYALPQTATVDDLIVATDEASDAEPMLKSPSVVFAFPGQGCQVPGMGKSLYRDLPGFRQAMDACATILQTQHGLDIKSLMFESADPLKDTSKTQISLFCLGYALASALTGLGIRPAAAIGHSIGELAAATLAGVFDLSTALRVVMTRGQVMQAQPSGAMLAVRASAETVAPLLTGGVVIAAENTGDSCTLAGDHGAITALGNTLEQNSINFKALNTSHAFHSPAMDDACRQFAEALSDVTLHSPHMPFISCITGDWITEQQATDIHYWASQIRQPVQFRAGVQTLGTLNNLVLLECGPQATVTGMVMQTLENKSDLALIPLLTQAGQPDVEVASFSRGLGQAWSKGVTVNWPCGQQNPVLNARLPGYPFQHRTHGIEPSVQAATAQPKTESIIPNPSLMQPAEALQTPLAGPAMKDAVMEQLRTLFTDISGIDLSQAENNATFFELGLDSLLLTQSTLKLKKKFKVSITFRQLLNDCGNLEKLADYLIKEGVTLEGTAPSQPPAASVGEPVSAQAPAPTLATAFTAQSAGEIQTLLQQQMQLMQGQLALLSSLTGQAQRAEPTHSNDQRAPAAPVPPGKDRTIPIKPFGAGTRINVKRSNDMTASQKANFTTLAERYNRRFAKSRQFAQDNRKHLADPRVVSGFRNVIKEVIYPIVVERSEGPYLWDIDGGKLIDVTCGFGSNFFGNSAPFIRDAIARQLATGYEIGPQHPLVTEVSRLFCTITGNERVAFCNTGSEAVVGAMRLARTVTAKEKVVIFENDYHGIHDDVIVTRGANGYAVPAAAGIPESAAANMIVLDYGSDASLDYIRDHADDIAAVLVEPVQSRNPDLQPKAFLHKARALCTDKQIALIFDEVITGFRIHPRGAQGYYGVNADICTYGKIVGGGMPIGVISGKARFMDALDGGQWQFGDDSSPEVGVTYFAGTFVRHPLTMAAAVAVLKRLEAEPDLQNELNRRADGMVRDINQYAQLVGAPLKIEHCGSMCKLKIPQDIAFEELIYILLREKGIHIWDARPMFITTAHSDEDLAAITTAFKEAMDAMIAMEFFPVTRLPADDVPDASPQPPVAGARLGRDEAGKAAWYIPSKTHKNQFEKWAG